jgi:multiple sugar transport system permease protein
MPLIPQVGRRSAKGRWLIGTLYVLLTLGALGILYPFTLMLSLSATGRLDYPQFRLVPLVLRGHAERFVYFLGQRYQEGDWTDFAAAYRAARPGYWNDVADHPRVFFDRLKLGNPDNREMERYEQFVASLPVDQVGFCHFNDAREQYERTVADRDPEAPKWLPNEPFEQLTWSPPDTDKYRRILRFRAEWPARDRKVITGRSLWVRWVRDKLSLAEANRLLGAQYASELDVPFLAEPLRARFFAEGCPRRLQGELPEMQYAKFIGSDRQWVDLPMAQHDYWVFKQNERHWFWHALTENYRQVIFYMITKGRAAVNTVILVVLSVASALIINPLAAYALSRFRLKAAPSILLFCLATSAFPAEVAMIPNFLLLRDLGWLNTFAALVIPGAANGFSIFLLKGFFDSLPRELYEAADLDGAGELTKFWHVTMRLSAPILAVTALGAFTAAFTGFMWAFLVCQDQKLWTLMVWLFQFQSSASASTSMAALVAASVPTLLVFLFCQRIILRGMILPEWK